MSAKRGTPPTHELDIKLDDELRHHLESIQEPLEAARHPGAAQQRARLVEQMRQARQEIAQIFLDCEHWNTQVRQPHERPVDPDPDGELRIISALYDRLLKTDTQ